MPGILVKIHFSLCRTLCNHLFNDDSLGQCLSKSTYQSHGFVTKMLHSCKHIHVLKTDNTNTF